MCGCCQDRGPGVCRHGVRGHRWPGAEHFETYRSRGGACPSLLPTPPPLSACSTTLTPRSLPCLGAQAFIAVVFQQSEVYDVDFLKLWAWTGLWGMLCMLIMSVCDMAALVRYVTNFTEDVHNALIATIFIVEVRRRLAIGECTRLPRVMGCWARSSCLRLSRARVPGRRSSMSCFTLATKTENTRRWRCCLYRCCCSPTSCPRAP